MIFFHVFTFFTPLNELDIASGRGYKRNPLKSLRPRASSPRARAQSRKNKNKYILIQVGPNSEQK